MQVVDIGFSMRQRQQKFYWGLWALAVAVLATTLWYVPDSSLAAITASLLISVASLIPAWLWIHDGASDIPIFPIYGVSFLWTYSLPLLGSQLYLEGVDESSKYAIGSVLALGLLVGTATWYWFRRGTPRKDRHSLQLPLSRMRGLLLAAMVANMFFIMGYSGQWYEDVPSEILTLFRVFISSLYVLAVFLHFYEIGAGTVRGPRAWIFLALFALSEAASSVTLLLVGTMLSILIAIAAFSLGRGRVPWKTIVASILVFSLLHAGKTEMRDKYWFGNMVYAPQPTDYADIYSEWIVNGIEAFTSIGTPGEREYQSLRERAGLAYIFLLVYESSPARVPYLLGASYEPIPGLLVPRFINPDRATTHEGTIILNVHYGLQTRESAMTATIAWDLIGEAQANFGIPGVIAAFAIFGFFYARIEKWARGHDIFSFRGLVCLIVLSMAAQAGLTMAVYVTALFQAMVALCALAVLAMERRQMKDLVAAFSLTRLGAHEGQSR